MNTADMTLDELATLVGAWANAHGYPVASSNVVIQCIGGTWRVLARCGPMTSGATAAATGWTMSEAIAGCARMMSVWLSENRPAEVIELTLDMIQTRAKRKLEDRARAEVTR